MAESGPSYREKLALAALETELKAAIAARELEAYDLKRENEYLRIRVDDEGRRIAHA
jgi:hypothetical protein